MKPNFKYYLEILPEVKKLRILLRQVKITEKGISCKSIPGLTEDIRESIKILNKIKGLELFENSTKFYEFKLGIIRKVLKDKHGVEL